MPLEIEVSVVLPCLNEEETLGICLQKIKEVFKQAGLKGEIIVADNGSSDRSKSIAYSHGALVVTEPRRGYGAAYLAGLRQVRGRYIVIADSDNTYDFYDIPRFLGRLKEGYDFVIGSRFKGAIKNKAMPWPNRYLGNPVISAMFRLFFRNRISDALCGMRAFTRSAGEKLHLRTLGMEFATEMLVAAFQNRLKLAEIPIDYHPRRGRSKSRPLADAWRHIRFMLLYCPLWLYFVPGLCGFILGMFILLFLLRGPFLFLGHRWDIHFVVFASALSILSYQLLNLGVYAHTYAISQSFLKYDRLTLFFLRHFSLEKGMVLGMVPFFGGLVINLFIFIEWFSRQFGPLYRIRESVLATTLLVIGLQTIFSSFFLSLLLLNKYEDPGD